MKTSITTFRYYNCNCLIYGELTVINPLLGLQRERVYWGFVFCFCRWNSRRKSQPYEQKRLVSMILKLQSEICATSWFPTNSAATTPHKIRAYKEYCECHEQKKKCFQKLRGKVFKKFYILELKNEKHFKKVLEGVKVNT